MNEKVICMDFRDNETFATVKQLYEKYFFRKIFLIITQYN